MTRWIPAILVILLALQACHSDSPPAPVMPPAPAPTNSLGTQMTPESGTDVVATVKGDSITRADLEPVLIEGYGLNVLLALVQLDLAEQEAARLHVVVTPQDVSDEHRITMDNLQQATEQLDSNGQPTTEPAEILSSEQQNQLLDRLLQQQHLSRAEFNVIIEVNAYLRKIAGPKVALNLTEDAVRQQFNAMYGEHVVVHYIVCNNMSEAADVRRDLASGKPFDAVATIRSIDRGSAANGGALPPFTLQDNRFPQEFKQVAFSLKKNEVSDPIQIGHFIFIAKLIDRIPPAHAKFEDYRESVKKYLYDSTVRAAMQAMRDRLAHMALDSLQIKDPTLAQQWADKINKKDGQIRDADEIRQQLDKEHAPATFPSGQRSVISPPIPPQLAAPVAPPATLPATAP